MEERFKYLLNRYLTKSADTEEIEEFRNFVSSIKNEGLIKAEIESVLDEHPYGEEESSPFALEIYERIRQECNIPEQKVKRINLIPKLAAAAMVIFAVGLTWYFSNRIQNRSVKDQVLTAKTNEDRTFLNKNYIHLPDGSTVLLKDSSKLTVIERNGQFLREVKLEGEAFFDIAHDKDNNFIVHTDGIKTRVLGTAFNVNAQTGKVEIKVTRGLVEVSSEEKVLGKIKAREQIQVNTGSDTFKISVLEPEVKVSPINGNFSFDEVTMDDALAQIGTRFHVQIFLENAELGLCRVSARFGRQESLENILSALCEMRNLEYRIELDKVIIKGDSSCK